MEGGLNILTTHLTIVNSLVFINVRSHWILSNQATSPHIHCHICTHRLIIIHGLLILLFTSIPASYRSTAMLPTQTRVRLIVSHVFLHYMSLFLGKREVFASTVCLYQPVTSVIATDMGVPRWKITPEFIALCIFNNFMASSSET